MASEWNPLWNKDAESLKGKVEEKESTRGESQLLSLTEDTAAPSPRGVSRVIHEKQWLLVVY